MEKNKHYTLEKVPKEVQLAWIIDSLGGDTEAEKLRVKGIKEKYPEWFGDGKAVKAWEKENAHLLDTGDLKARPHHTVSSYLMGETYQESIDKFNDKMYEIECKYMFGDEWEKFYQKKLKETKPLISEEKLRKYLEDLFEARSETNNDRKMVLLIPFCIERGYVDRGDLSQAPLSCGNPLCMSCTSWAESFDKALKEEAKNFLSKDYYDIDIKYKGVVFEEKETRRGRLVIGKPIINHKSFNMKSLKDFNVAMANDTGNEFSMSIKAVNKTQATIKALGKKPNAHVLDAVEVKPETKEAPKAGIKPFETKEEDAGADNA